MVNSCLYLIRQTVNTSHLEYILFIAIRNHQFNFHRMNFTFTNIELNNGNTRLKLKSHIIIFNILQSVEPGIFIYPVLDCESSFYLLAFIMIVLNLQFSSKFHIQLSSTWVISMWHVLNTTVHMSIFTLIQLPYNIMWDSEHHTIRKMQKY